MVIGVMAEFNSEMSFSELFVDTLYHIMLQKENVANHFNT